MLATQDMGLLRGVRPDRLDDEVRERGYRDGLRGVSRADVLPVSLVDQYQRGFAKGFAKVPTR